MNNTSQRSQSSRAQHLQWCKDRAMEYVRQHQPETAVLSMMSELKKHPETCEHLGIQLGARLMMGGFLVTEKQVTEWVEGFN